MVAGSGMFSTISNATWQIGFSSFLIPHSNALLLFIGHEVD